MAQIPLLTVSDRTTLEPDQDIELRQSPGEGKSVHDALIRSRDSGENLEEDLKNHKAIPRHKRKEEEEARFCSEGGSLQYS